MPNRARIRPFAVVVSMLTAAVAAQAKAPPKGDVRLVGRIVNVLHEGVPAAEVHVTDGAGTVVGRTIADGDGFFQMHRLPSDIAELHASGERFVPGRMPIVAQGLVRAATLVLEDGDPLHGTVSLADGTPAAHAAVLVTTRYRLDPPFDWFAETTTDAKGKWSLPAAPLRPLLLRAFTPGVPVLELDIERDRDGAADARFTGAKLEPRRVVVRGAAPGTDAVVYYETHVPHSQHPTRWPTAVAEVRCDANGDGLLWPLPIPSEVRLRAIGHRSMPIAIPVRDDKHPVLEFTLSPVPPDVAAPSTKMRGRLVDALGQPLANIAVVGREDTRTGSPTMTASDGTFELDVPARPGVLCHVAVRSPDHTLVAAQMETTRDGLRWQRIQADPDKVLALAAMPAGTIRDTLHLPSGAPFAAARVQIDLIATGGGTVESATDAGGRVLVTGLPDGLHTVHVHTPSARGTRKVEIVAGQVARIEPLVFEEAGEAFGVVTDPTGRPLPGMSLVGSYGKMLRMPKGMMVRGRGAMTEPWLTDRNGRFRIPYMPAGRWELYAYDLGRDDHRTVATVVEVVDGARVEVALPGLR
ncbi:MAG: hypothetical protein JNK15_04570 [Planctomycetes bacterium]|nr:hypothetical protein [Planctomycetota bacterium]